MDLRFTKMHGLGNDFVMLDFISQQPVTLEREMIQKWADRRLGIGFDQLLTVEPPEQADLDFRYRIYNADGSKAEQCGNGARCVLAFVRAQGLTTKTQIKLETTKGIVACQLGDDGKVSVDMGPPTLAPDKIPFIAEQTCLHYELTLPRAVCGNDTVQIAAVNMGNPHAVINVQDINKAPVHELGGIIESHLRFPERVNVGFMEVVTPGKIKLRVYERGVGETSACGTGACAAVVAGRLQGLLDEQVAVHLHGGKLSINWADETASVTMTGPVCHVYEGRLQL